MDKAIQDAQTGRIYTSTRFHAVDVARNYADLIETVMQAASKAAVELVALSISETGNGSTEEAQDFLECVEADTAEKLLSVIREDAFAMELDLGSLDPDAEHRLSACQLGLSSIAAE